ncbi:hypothetical protein FQN54_000439 [Arachnomyces sp. PD_36]|nr:hypothetical protein FQN54_000439 [Arachnomyces sp. PD_36]
MPSRRPRSSSMSQSQPLFDPRQQAPINGTARAVSYGQQGGSRKASIDPTAGNSTDQSATFDTAQDILSEPSQPQKDPYVVTGPTRQADEVRSFSARTRDLPPNKAFAHPDDFSPLEQSRYVDRSTGQPAPRNGQRPPAQQTDGYRRASDAVAPPQSNNSMSPPTRTNTLKSTEGEKGRGWASDRSPLQKLEVKLGDITREEKRARVEEAEMLARERMAARARGQDTTSQPTRNRSVKEPSGSNVADLARSQSKAQAPRQRGAPQEPQDPGARNMPLDNRGAYPEQSYRQENLPKPSNRRGSAMQYAPEGGYAPRTPTDQTNYRSSSNAAKPQHARRQSTAYAVENPTNPAQLRDLNATNRSSWAGAAPIGPASAAALERSNNQNYQMPPPPSQIPQPQPAYGNQTGPVDDRTQGVQRSVSARAAPPQQPADAPIGVSKKAQDKLGLGHPSPVGLGLRNSPDEQQTGSPENPAGVKSTKTRSKPQTVSFAVPPPTPPPLMEWKNAPVAKLRAVDLLRDIDQSVAWWEGGRSDYQKSKSFPREEMQQGKANKNTIFQPALYLQCGPLLRYTGIKRETIDRPNAPCEKETWRGSVMIVTRDSESSYDPAPTLRLFSQPMDLLPPPPTEVTTEHDTPLAPEYVDPIAGLTKVGRTGKTLYVKPVDHLEEGVDLSLVEDDDGLFEETPSPVDRQNGTAASSANGRIHSTDGEGLGKYKQIQGVRLYADSARDVTFWRFNLEVELGERQERIAYRINRGPAVGFWVPAKGETMNMMFHSCNGFSIAAEPDHFNGPDPMWRDVLNSHQTRPFHVMIGGGDQIYNDKVMIETEIFQEWTKLKNPHEKHHHPFSAELRAELETFYLQRYSMWFSQGLFGLANCQIPMVNIWDDHDIIDGFGSYPDNFMKSPVFAGLGGIAYKYYLLFQHQSVPEETDVDESSWILGDAPGPYIKQKSRHLLLSMGKNVTFLGLDCRTERMKDEILAGRTYERIWDRCYNEIVKGETKHLIVLSGVPIAYPRLVWLENVLTSRVMDPVKALGRAGMFGGLLNKFDGGVEVLDDLDDHWTSKNHKAERTWLIEDLQDIAAEKSIRVTVLGGDVHLAAMGQFYSNPKLNVPKDRDYRYMPNVISSAIVNAAPPELLADVLNKRNKVHHLDSKTDEDMIPIFNHDVDGKPRNNKRLLPRRNWCSIREYHPGSTPPPSQTETMTPTPDPADFPPEKPKRSFSFSRGDAPPGGGLFRRLSLRGPPPTTGSPAFGNFEDRRRMSVDAHPRPPETGDSYFASAHSQEGLPHRPRTQQHNPAGSTRTPTPPRPNFHRRPTNLRRKSVIAKKRAEEDNEENDHVNLEGGLDITLNCEVSPADPAGITTPYKLLVPALWYDGGLEPSAEPVKKGLLKRMFSKKKKRVEEEEEYDDEEEEYEEDWDEKGGDHQVHPEQSSNPNATTPAAAAVPTPAPAPAPPAPQRGFPAAANDGIDDGYGGYGGYEYDDDQVSEGELSDEQHYREQQRLYNEQYQQRQHPEYYQSQNQQQYAQQGQPHQGYAPGQQQRPTTQQGQGYSGIEAYEETKKKKKRRWF